MIFPRWLPDGPALFLVPATAFHPCCNSLVRSPSHLHLHPPPGAPLAPVVPQTAEMLERSRAGWGGDRGTPGWPWGSSGGQPMLEDLQKPPSWLSFGALVPNSSEMAFQLRWEGCPRFYSPAWGQVPSLPLSEGPRGGRCSAGGWDPTLGSVGTSPCPGWCSSFE